MCESYDLRVVFRKNRLYHLGKILVILKQRDLSRKKVTCTFFLWSESYTQNPTHFRWMPLILSLLGVASIVINQFIHFVNNELTKDNPPTMNELRFLSSFFLFSNPFFLCFIQFSSSLEMGTHTFISNIPDPFGDRGI